MKKMILGVSLLTGLTVGFTIPAFSQANKEVYEFGGLIYSAAKAGVIEYRLCFNTKDKYECSEGKVDDGSIYHNIKIALEKLNTLSKEGWEVYAAETSEMLKTWHLRRKIN